jgi:hypothetical protein
MKFMIIRAADMKTFLFLAFATASVSGAPPPPSADQVTEWAAFSKSIHLKVNEHDRDDSTQWGSAIWMVDYEARKETLSTYMIGLFKAGTLFGENRAEMEKAIREQVKGYAKLEKKYPNKDHGELQKHVRIESRPDGRKVYFTVLGFGPGGAAFGAFTTVGQYDLFLLEGVTTETDTPTDKRVKDPAKPTKELSDIFRLLEKHITTAK